MRVLICDDHVIFAESLAYLLMAFNREVVEVTHHPSQAVAALRRTQVDICLLDVVFGSESAVGWLPALRGAAPQTRILLLCGLIDAALLAASRAAGVRGIIDKRQPVMEVIGVMDQVHAGELVVPDKRSVEPPHNAALRPATAAVRHLATYLTPREREVLSALVCGADTTKLARTMGIAQATARCHIQSVLIKMGAHSRLEAATSAVRHGMVDPETGEWLIAAE
jgi:two-component system, NarL family, nitrate/nitrite response regulator NarL